MHEVGSKRIAYIKTQDMIDLQGQIKQLALSSKIDPHTGCISPRDWLPQGDSAKNSAREAMPRPATRAIWTQWKAGETWLEAVSSTLPVRSIIIIV